MRLKLSKCKFAVAELPFLGHIIRRSGLKMDPAKIEKLIQLKNPSTKKQVRQFLGLAGYFRNFIKDFEEISAPLSNLTKNTSPDSFSLSEQELQAISLLKQKITEYPILQFPDFNLPFILETDASSIKIAAVLLQKQKNATVLLSRASRLLKLTQLKATTQL